MGQDRRKKERYEVLFEKIESSVQVVLDGHSTLNREIEALGQDVRGVKEELSHVEKAVMENNGRLKTLIDRFEIHRHAHTN